MQGTMNYNELLVWCSEKHTEEEIEEVLDDNMLTMVRNIELINLILKHSKVSEEMIDLFNTISITDVWVNGRIDWTNVIQFQKLSDKFILDHLKYFPRNCKQNRSLYKSYINMILQFQILGEDLIKKFYRIADKDIISKYQILSQDFIIKHKKSLNISLVLRQY